MYLLKQNYNAFLSNELAFLSTKKNNSRNLQSIHLRNLGFDRKIALPESHGGRKVSTIQEFSSDDLMDARDPPLSSHIL